MANNVFEQVVEFILSGIVEIPANFASHLQWETWGVYDGNRFPIQQSFLVGKTPLGRAALREAARRDALNKGIPSLFVEEALSVQYGRELLKHVPAEVWKKFEGVALRPRLNRYGDLPKWYFEEWYRAVIGGSGDTGFTGPRAEAFVKVVLGREWKKCYAIK